MTQQVIAIGPQLNERRSLDFAAELNLLESQCQLLVDFSGTQHFEPFSMLLAGSAIRRTQVRMGSAGGAVTIRTDGAHEIAGHMGFWRSFGVPEGRGINAAPESEHYVAVSCLDVGQLPNNVPLMLLEIEKQASRLARVLVADNEAPLSEATMLSLREILRNGVEHSMSPSVWYAGMRWQSRGYVQVAVLDEGRGIRESLNRSGHYSFQDDISAIDAALRPGVSRNKGRRLSRDEFERWSEARPELPVEFYQNSGYGLPIASGIGREAGQFMLVSGNRARQIIGGECSLSTSHVGTAIRMVLYPERINGAVDRVFDSLGAGGNKRNKLISASMMRRLGLHEGDA